MEEQNQIKQELFSRYGRLIAWGVISVLFAIALLLLAQFAGAFKEIKFIGQGIEFRNTISVSGEGEVIIVPDTAEFSFAVVKEADEVLTAQTEVTNTMNSVLKFLKDFGVEEKNVKTTNYSITPRYEYRNNPKIDRGGAPLYYPYPSEGERVLVGYEVSHDVTVKVKKIDDTGELIGKVGSLGATNISNVNFTVEDEEKVLDEAREKAITDAKKKASLLARNLNVRLVKIVNFSEGGGVPIYYRSFAKSADFGVEESVAPAPEIPIGENTVTSYVTIVYAID